MSMRVVAARLKPWGLSWMSEKRGRGKRTTKRRRHHQFLRRKPVRSHRNPGFHLPKFLHLSNAARCETRNDVACACACPWLTGRGCCGISVPIPPLHINRIYGIAPPPRFATEAPFLLDRMMEAMDPGARAMDNIHWM